MSLWGGRFKQKASLQFKQFNDSLPVDYRMAVQDIVGSMSWARALNSVQVLTDSESAELVQALEELKTSVENNPEQILEADAEDIHSWVEVKLIEKTGDLGKKLHTGRSRNDQVATDLKLWCKEKGDELYHALLTVKQALLDLAEREHGTVLPGYTHLQRAQPVTFGHWCLAYVEMFDRDISRLKDALYRADTSPLGCGALAGTAYPIDREDLAHHLGFRTATLNSLDAVSDRDHVIELLSTASISMIHLSRFAEDLIFYNSGEAGFVEMSDLVSSGSSLMPQKKNPDACELIRGKSGRVTGSLTSMLMTMKALPLAYNKDMQEDKEGLFDALDTWQECLLMATLVAQGLTVKSQRTLTAAQQGYANATELADYLVSKGIPFREAHHIVGEVVLEGIEQKLPLEALTLEQLQKFSPHIEQDVYQHLLIDATLEKRQALGGTSPQQVEHARNQAQAKQLAQTAELNSSKAQVRNAKTSDANAIFSLVKAQIKPSLLTNFTLARLLQNIQHFVVAHDNNKVIGCASLAIYEAELAGVEAVVIEPSYQSQELGHQLVRRLFTIAERIGVPEVLVMTALPDYFKQLGFVDNDALSDSLKLTGQFIGTEDVSLKTAMTFRLTP